MTDDTAPRTYNAEDIERFAAALAAVATQQLHFSERELYARLMTIKLIAEDLGKQLTSDNPGDREINWVQYQTGVLERRAADIAEGYGSKGARA